MEDVWSKSAQPGEAHDVLREQAGSWTVSARIWMAPDAQPMESAGRATRTMIMGDRVLEERFESDMMGQRFEGIGHTGFDNVTGRYWSTWFDTMSTGLTMLAGHRDDDGVFVYEGQTPDPVVGGPVPMRIENRLEGPAREHFTFHKGDGQGGLFKTMEMIYERVDA